MINVSILFPGGCYGTFIEWCLNYFSDPNFDQTLPFTETGSSHKFLGNHLLNCEVLTNNIDAGRRYNICRLHPKTEKEDNIIENCNFVKSVSNRVVYIYPGYDSFVWTINNKFEKVWAQGWLKHQESDITDNLKQWNSKSLEFIEDWEIREFLSFYIYQQHVAECEVDHIDLLKQKFNDFYFINVKEIRDNFETLIPSLLDYCGLPMIRNDQIENIYSKWADVQYHKNKDYEINKITNAILENQIYSWEDKDLTLIDQAFIQMNLYKNNIEIRCANLNKFPTSTKELEPFLFTTS